jgi:hypothetical protein
MRKFALIGLLAASTAHASPGAPLPDEELQVAIQPQALKLTPKLLARYYVAVRPDAVLSGSRAFRVKSKGLFTGKVTVVVRRVTEPGLVVARVSGTLRGTSTVGVALPLNGSNTPPYCLTGENHYQISVWSGDAPLFEGLTQSVAPSSLVQACRGTRTAWFNPVDNYPGGVAPGAGAAGAPQAFRDCLDHEAAVFIDSTLRPGEDPWPDPDPGIAVNPDWDACR